MSFVSRDEELTLVQVEALIKQRIRRVELAGYEPKSRDALLDKMHNKPAFRDRRGRTNNPTEQQSDAERRARLRRAVLNKSKITKLNK